MDTFKYFTRHNRMSNNATKNCLRNYVVFCVLLFWSLLVSGNIQQSSLPHLPSFTSKSSISSDSKLVSSSQTYQSSCKITPTRENTVIIAQQSSLSSPLSDDVILDNSMPQFKQQNSLTRSECPSTSLTSNTEIQNVPIRTIDDFDCAQLDFCSDRLGFEAILYLHRQLDEDANGDIDISESDEFLRDELKYENCAERQKAFHGNDKHITVDELWRSWKMSPVHNWTVEETVDWLCSIVELPKYKEKFEQHSINGVALPRLAASSQFFTILGINNPIHRQKLALKAMDVVLFGIPKPNTLVKDLVMCVLVVFLIAVAWYAYYQHKFSQTHIRKMMKDMESLSNAEKQLEYLQLELNRTKQEHENASKEKRDLERKLKENEQQHQILVACNEELFSSYNETRPNLEDHRVAALEKELLLTQKELKRLEQANAARQWIPSIALQQYLQLTYEIEIKNYNMKKSVAEMQLHAARDGCDKLKKKRSTLLGAFRMAHGSSIDYVDNTILQARTMLAELTNEMQERIKRWKQIEAFCGFDIIHNPGLLHLEQALYGSSTTVSTAVSTSSVTSKPLISTRKGSESIIDDDSLSLVSVPPYLNTVPYLSNQFTGFPNGVGVPMKKVSSISSGMFSNYLPSSFEEDSETMVSSMDDTVSKISNYSFNKRPSATNVTFSNSPVTSNELPQFRSKTTQPHPKMNLLYFRRGSSDGVERHFEDILASQQTISSQSDNSISSNYNNCLSCVQQSPKQTDSLANNNTVNSSSENTKDGSNEEATNASSIILKKYPFIESNDETMSSSSDSTTMTSNNHTDNRTTDFNGNSTSNNSKKRNFFGIRKRKSSKIEKDKINTEK